VVWHEPVWVVHTSSSDSMQFNVNCALHYFLMYRCSTVSWVMLHYSIKAP
jgi:hypothetical protein